MPSPPPPPPPACHHKLHHIYIHYTQTMNVDFNGAEITLVKTRYKNDIPLDRMKEIVREVNTYCTCR